MYNPPFFGFPFFKNYYYKKPFINNTYSNLNLKYNNGNYHNNINESKEDNYKNKNSTTNHSSSTINNNFQKGTKDQVYISFLGIDLYSDDILILCILLSLYLEGVKDEMLFISLILLLLS